MIQDLRHAFRVLLHAPAWTAVVIASLALGIGANTALFSAVNGLLVRRVAVADPDSLVRLRYAGRNEMVTSSSDYGYSAPDAGEPVRATFSYPIFRQFEADNRTLADLTAFAPNGRVNLVVDGAADVATAFVCAGNYYGMLGVSARLGRVLHPDDDQPAAAPVAIISHRYWRTRFGGDPNVIGKVVRANNVPVTIVGVLPPEFTGIQRAVAEPPDVSFPLSLDRQLSSGPAQQRLSQPTYWWLQVVGRLKPGATSDHVEANLGGVFEATARAGLDAYLGGLSEEERGRSSNQNRSAAPRLIVHPAAHGVYDVNETDIRSVTILSGVAGLILVIVCANAANLLLARASARQKELAVRLSLGATRGRLIRQLLTESVLLSFLGAALGVAIGYWAQLLLPGTLGRTAALDWRVLWTIAGLATATGIAFGIAPALRATRADLSSGLKESGRAVAASRTRLGKSLLVVQVAISLVLLVGAGLFLRTLQNLRNVDVGFNAGSLALFRLSPQLNGYDIGRARAVYEQLLERIAAVPGVRRVSLSNLALLSGGVNTSVIFVPGRTYTPEARDSIHRLVVSPGFFETLEIPLLTGRLFTPRDDAAAPKVAVINETAARRYFADGQPIGRRFGNNLEQNSEIEVVGVVRDVKYNALREPAPPTVYLPYPQAPLPSAIFEVRTAGDPVNAMAAIREAVRQVDAQLPLMDVSTQSQQIENRLLQERVFAQAYFLFGALAVVLAGIGLFGLMSYSVARRTNEIGIRMALGARQASVLGLVMRESMLLVAIGLIVGLAGAAAAGRLVANQLFGLAAGDLLTHASATALILLVTVVASFLPARRASRVDPMTALRCE